MDIQSPHATENLNDYQSRIIKEAELHARQGVEDAAVDGGSSSKASRYRRPLRPAVVALPLEGGGSGWTQLQASGTWAAAVVERRYRRSSRASRRCRLRLRPGGRRGRGALHRGVSGGGFVGPTIRREESGGPRKENNWYKTGCGACRVRATELGRRRLGSGME
jgi:hypothetical protein